MENININENNNVHEGNTNCFAISDECQSSKNSVFAIHEDFFPEVEKKINKIIKKCEKYGNPFTFEVVGTEMRRDSRSDIEDSSNKYNDIFHKFIIVKVEGEAKVGEWEFVATLDIHSNGNVIRRYNTEVALPDYFKTSPNVCNHCNTARDRKNLYVVRNIETGEFRQVGGSCLKSYSGISLEHVAAIMDGIDILFKYDNLYDGDFVRVTPYYSVKDVISVASTIIDKAGYFNVYSALSTRSMVYAVLSESNVKKGVDELNKELEYCHFGIAFSAEEFEVDNSADVDAIIDHYMSLDNDSEFIHNMQTIISEGYVTSKDLGFLCYAPQGYAKHMEREVERAKRNTWKREHWGEIGKRYKNVPVQEVRKVAGYLTDYGVMNIWQIVIEDGTVLTWKSSNYPDDEISTVTFTIKEHGEYKGVPQTIVTRCKFASAA